MAVLLIAPMPARAEADIRTRVVEGTDLSRTREALIESIEAEGLVVSNIVNFNEMLARTAGDLGRRGAPFAAVEIVQFCSSVLAWQLIEESPAQVALCPLSISLQLHHGRPKDVVLAWREPQASSAGRQKAIELLRHLVQRTAELAR
ncbi:MAG: hypothetical protein CFR70_14830 [Rhodocyclaceae bacterium]|nr:MAG: hypothetical protein CFR70_14830 [Rhodocyclaceae bacterium]